MHNLNKSYNPYKPQVSLVWATENGDQMIADMARVSVKDNEGKPVEKLVKYMADHGHNSPFDMANLCVEIRAPRDISRQILRHWSIKPQEFSQRYSVVDEDMFVTREARKQHPTNRQMSVPLASQADESLAEWWEDAQQEFIADAHRLYNEALKQGLAKEVARVVLPEGNTMSRLYMNGSIRSWVHYLKTRCDIDSTQREHVWVAEMIKNIFASTFPIVYAAFFSLPEYELVHSASGSPVCKARSEADVRRWAEIVFIKADELVISFQPTYQFCRVNYTSNGVRHWADYKLIETGE